MDNPIDYSETLKNTAHPAGLQAFFEMGLEDYIPPDNHDEDHNLCEISFLGNYFPYRLSHSTGLTGCAGCSGSGYIYDGTGYDHWNHAGPEAARSGWSGATFDMPTHNFPNWAEGVSCDVQNNEDDPFCTGHHEFGNIYIGDFVYLCNQEDSPNLGVTGCTASCDSGGGACWGGFGPCT